MNTDSFMINTRTVKILKLKLKLNECQEDSYAVPRTRVVDLKKDSLSETRQFYPALTKGNKLTQELRPLCTFEHPDLSCNHASGPFPS